MSEQKIKRIWELDAFRGFCIIGVIIVHLVYDLRMFFGIFTDTHPVFDFIQQNGGILFVVLSGICITLGRHNIKRGLLVAAGALVITLVTTLMGGGVQIYFGVLHLLALCMLTYGIYKKLPPVLTLVIGTTIVITGYWFMTFTVNNPYLFPLGLLAKGFYSADYFPIFPYLGFFMIGTFLGKTIYKKKETLFPKVNEENIIVRFFSWCGRMSFFIYLGHQPILYGACLLVYTLINK